jgi:hypothetical protein
MRSKAKGKRQKAILRPLLPFAFCLLPSHLCASPALPGFTGVLTTPTAFSQAFQSGALGFAQYRGHTRAFLNYGVWETGEIVLSADGLKLRAHAKYTLLPESPRTPALAVGGTELLGRRPSFYAVASGNVRVRSGGSQLRLSGGLATRGALSPLFAGAELRINRVATFQTEWSPQWNTGLRINPSAQFRVMVGFVRRRAGLGVSYDIGL